MKACEKTLSRLFRPPPATDEQAYEIQLKTTNTT